MTWARLRPRLLAVLALLLAAVGGVAAGVALDRSMSQSRHLGFLARGTAFRPPPNRHPRSELLDRLDASLDLTGVPDFHRRCYEILLTIGWGKTTTYGDMARRLGGVGLSRAVGQAMGANPIPLIIPCHRVLAAGGGAGGFSAPGGTTSKRAMLALEGVSMGAPPGQMQFAF